LLFFQFDYDLLKPPDRLAGDADHLPADEQLDVNLLFAHFPLPFGRYFRTWLTSHSRVRP
jgi:hypothetical protein